MGNKKGGNWLAMVLDVVQSYTDKPGARYKSQGRFSGEEFRDEILYPKFMEAIENGEELIVNLDGGYGYGSSFLEESFGGLVRKLKQEKSANVNCVKDIKIVSNDNIAWVDKISEYISNAMKQ